MCLWAAKLGCACSFVRFVLALLKLLDVAVVLLVKLGDLKIQLVPRCHGLLECFDHVLLWLVCGIGMLDVCLDAALQCDVGSGAPCGLGGLGGWC